MKAGAIADLHCTLRAMGLRAKHARKKLLAVSFSQSCV